MNPDEVRSMIQTEIMAHMSQASLGTSYVPYHTHNGTDSAAISTVFILTEQIMGTEAATAGNYSVFFLNPSAHLTVTGITEIHSTKGTDVSAVTLQVEKLTGTEASGTGTALLNTAFNLKGANNTLQTGSLIASSVRLFNGERLGLVLTGTPTAVANVIVTVTLNEFTS